MIEEANGQPVLVFYAFRHERDRIIERYPEAVDIKEDGAVVRWNEGKIPIMLAHPASAGHGQKKTVLMKGTYDYRVLDDILAPKEVQHDKR